MRSIPGGAAVVAACLLIAALTLAPGSPTASAISIWCIGCGERGLADLLLNILLFIPLGAALGRNGATPVRALLVGAAFSAFIEFAQLALPGRTPTARDIITNAVGAWLGALLMLHLGDWLTRGSRASRNRRLWLATALPIIAVLATGWLLQPVLTNADPYGQWAPSLGRFEQWTGDVTAVEVSGLPLPGGRIEAEAEMREALLNTSDPIRITATAGSAPDGTAPIFAIADIERHHLLIIAQEHTDLAVRTFRRSSLLRLDTPRLRLAGVLADVKAGDPLDLEVHGAFAMRTCASVNGLGSCAAGFGPGSLWTVLVWQNALGDTQRAWLDAFTLLVLALPAGLLLRAAHRPHAVGATLVLFAGVGVATAATGLESPAINESAGLALGLLAGVTLSRLLPRYFPSRTRSRAVRSA